MRQLKKRIYNDYIIYDTYNGTRLISSRYSTKQEIGVKLWNMKFGFANIVKSQ